MKASLLTRTLLVSAVDLTRACAAQEHYCEWLANTPMLWAALPG